MKVVDSEGKPAPLWLIKMLTEGNPRDEFWEQRRREYRVIPC